MATIAEQDYRLDTGYAVGLVVVRGNVIVDTAPIFRWMRGLAVDLALNRLRRRGQLLSWTRTEEAGDGE